MLRHAFHLPNQAQIIGSQSHCLSNPHRRALPSVSSQMNWAGIPAGVLFSITVFLFFNCQIILFTPCNVSCLGWFVSRSSFVVSGRLTSEWKELDAPVVLGGFLTLWHRRRWKPKLIHQAASHRGFIHQTQRVIVFFFKGQITAGVLGSGPDCCNLVFSRKRTHLGVEFH